MSVPVNTRVTLPPSITPPCSHLGCPQPPPLLAPACPKVNGAHLPTFFTLRMYDLGSDTQDEDANVLRTGDCISLFHAESEVLCCESLPFCPSVIQGKGVPVRQSVWSEDGGREKRSSPLAEWGRHWETVPVKPATQPSPPHHSVYARKYQPAHLPCLCGKAALPSPHHTYIAFKVPECLDTHGYFRFPSFFRPGSGNLVF